MVSVTPKVITASCPASHHIDVARDTPELVQAAMEWGHGIR